MINFSQLPEITGGTLENFTNDSVITSLITDTRKAVVAEGALFFAIKGPHHDGHEHITWLYEKGVRSFVVERAIKDLGLTDANIIVVNSSLQALQAVAAFHRQSIEAPVVGITGSNGKTIVKEWMFQLLSPEYKIAKNPGSYNSQLGVPLSVWQFQPYHQMGIFEAGISRPGEMEKLASIIKPDIGIFTNIGSAHDEGFRSTEEKIAEKLKLFDASNIVIYCKDHKLIDAAISESGLPSLSWGLSSTAGIQVRQKERSFAVSFKGVSFQFSLPFSDKASVENCFHCIAAMIYLDYSPEKIQERIQLLQSVPMRLELKEGINQSQVIDDSYNNDLAGLQISLEFLTNQHQKKKKRLILSDILESGLPNDLLTDQITALLAKHGIEHFIGIGKGLSSQKEKFPRGTQFFATTSEFIDAFDFDSIQEEVVLVKGARVFEFERIIRRLQRKVHGTIMEIDLGAVAHNLNFFKARLRPSTKIMVMVKAFAYGSGSAEIANLLQYHKVNYLGVAYADEGVDLRKNNISLPIMVMNPSEESFGTILQYRLEPEVYSFRILNALLKFLKGRNCSIHVKLDTGMHRLGFEERDVDELIKILKEHSHVKVASIFSHLAGADEAEHDKFSEAQATQFLRSADKISDVIGYKPIYHILNSSGILRLSHLHMDLVRLGIGLYGVNPTSDKNEGLKPVATLKTFISQVKEIPAGESIGYGRRGKTDKKTKIATIAIGYADGYSRAFSRGVGQVLIRGKLAPVIGNVCMDMTMVDITGIPAEEGDEAIIFGPGLSIQQIASLINTIPYEILTNTSERVKRIFVAESI